MIKVIGFDLVGVLAREKDIELSDDEEKLERLFGPNVSDDEFQKRAQQLVGKDNPVFEIANNIISKLYDVRDNETIKLIRSKNKNIKIIVATNHISLIRKYVEKNFDVDDIIISAEINRMKPNIEFYDYILNKYSIKPNEFLFLDDNQENVDGAKKMGINVIKVNSEVNIKNEIMEYL